MSASRILELETILGEASTAYYNDEAIMEDFEFDALEAELRQLDPNNAHFKGVGAAPASATGKVHWKKAIHSQPMGSLSKVQTPGEFSDWAKKRGNHDFIIMPKFDGLSISLEYRDGRFVQAITRGDGIEGDDVTVNVMRIPFPKTFARYTGFIRGEVMIRKSSFAKNFIGEKNPRNSAVGTLKRLDGAKCEFLTIFAYGITMKNPLSTKHDEIMMLRGAGFETYPVKVGDAGDVLADYQDHIAGVRAALDYEIDGLVVAINDRDEREALGETDMRPNGAVAFKFPHEEAVSILRDVVWQVGTTGRIAPVAIFDPIQVSGVTVNRASLATAARVQSLKLFAGCRVVISRRNDVIPYLEKNLDA